MSAIRNLLSIAGSDPSGGAGVQADIKTFSALGAYGMAAITALTAQNTRGVSAVSFLTPDFIVAQLDAVFSDIRVDAVKIGMLANAAIVGAVADCLKRWRPEHIILDPVLAATSGDLLGTPDVVAAMITDLFPLADLITPNLSEAARLTNRPNPEIPEDIAAIGAKLLSQGARAALVKGGHSTGAESIDYLFAEDGTQAFSAPRLQTRNNHGTGCALSAAIAVYLAQGQSLQQAIHAAKVWLSEALAKADQLSVGSDAGHGPILHFHQSWRQIAVEAIET